jgi:murein DD-endopeptidase MepM/ murein hydrolase activator NlpD
MTVLALLGVSPGPSRAAAGSGTWAWPVVGPVIRPFDPPDSPYGSGHRGIDIAAPLGSPVRAPAPGIVSFSGKVGGHVFVSVDHGGGLVSTYSWLSASLVHKGDSVASGSVLALSGPGHEGVLPSHLHFGVKLNGEYVDPLSVLLPPSVSAFIRLAPMTGGP